mmetsp:Transcript_76624/g.150206  ORF Transcript_76624/g.150206 Transcript_76624/m.150206 type:complete len:148 (+) Transcript_76624:208-651(+)
MNEDNPRVRKNGSAHPKSRVYFLVNGVDVYKDFKGAVLGVFGNLIDKAVTGARAGGLHLIKRDGDHSLGTSTEHSVFESDQVKMAVSLCSSTVKASGAELLPMASFAGAGTVETLLKLTNMDTGNELDELSGVRLRGTTFNTAPGST